MTTAQAGTGKRPPNHLRGMERVKWMRCNGWDDEVAIMRSMNDDFGPGAYSAAITSRPAKVCAAARPRPAAGVMTRGAAVAKAPARAPARKAAPAVSGTATGRAIIAPLQAAGCANGCIVAALELGLDLDTARAVATAKSGSALLAAADKMGMNKYQVTRMAQAQGVAHEIGIRDLTMVRDVPRSRDPGRAWDANASDAAQRCRAFFGEQNRSAFLSWAAAEERDGRAWTASAHDLHPVGGW